MVEQIVAKRGRGPRALPTAGLVACAGLLAWVGEGAAQTDTVLTPAQEPAAAVPPADAPGGGPTRYSLGLGLGTAPDYEGSEDYTILPLWQFRATNLYGPTTTLELQGLKLTGNLLPHRQLRLGPVLQFQGKRGSVENDAVDDLRNVDPGLFVGLVGGWDVVAEPERSFGVFVEARGDVANGHGWLVTPGLRGRSVILPGLSLAGSLTMNWASESYLADYFAIDAADARRSGLDRHDTDAGLKDAGLTLALGYDLTERWQAGLLARYSRLLGDAADSPIVEDEGSANQLFGGVTMGLRF